MKILLTATVQSHICQFHKPLVEVLHKHGCEVHVAAKNNLNEKNGLKLNFVEKIFDIPFSRSPKSMDNIRAYKQLKRIIDSEGYDVIHCNTPMGGIITRLAGRKARKYGTEVYYTAHGFHFYKEAPKKNWIMYYPIEKFFANHFTDKLITITKEDYQLASSKFRTEVYHIFGVGVNSKKYYPMSVRKKQELRRIYGYDLETPILLCVGELNKNKNQTTVIRALAEVRKHIPNCKLLLAGNGPSNDELHELAQKLSLENAIDFLGYTLDLEKYLNIADVLISLSFREGMPFNIMEAMLCGTPVIASNNRGHRELITSGVNGILVSNADINKIAKKIVCLLENKILAKELSNTAQKHINKYKDVSVASELEQIYFSNIYGRGIC